LDFTVRFSDIYLLKRDDAAFFTVIFFVPFFILVKFIILNIFLSVVYISYEKAKANYIKHQATIEVSIGLKEFFQLSLSLLKQRYSNVGLKGISSDVLARVIEITNPTKVKFSLAFS
jgi:regulatory protein YycI of two-component signal transduction system YycFG